MASPCESITIDHKHLWCMPDVRCVDCLHRLVRSSWYNITFRRDKKFKRMIKLLSNTMRCALFNDNAHNTVIYIFLKIIAPIYTPTSDYSFWSENHFYAFFVRLCNFYCCVSANAISFFLWTCVVWYSHNGVRKIPTPYGVFAQFQCVNHRCLGWELCHAGYQTSNNFLSLNLIMFTFFFSSSHLHMQLTFNGESLVTVQLICYNHAYDEIYRLFTYLIVYWLI